MSAAPQPISFEEILSAVRAKRRGRLVMRQEMRRNGLLQDGLYDREQRVWNALEQHLARCLVRRSDVIQLLERVAVDPIDDSDLHP